MKSATLGKLSDAFIRVGVNIICISFFLPILFVLFSEKEFNVVLISVYMLFSLFLGVLLINKGLSIFDNALEMDGKNEF
jgi:hypothetical protein